MTAGEVPENKNVFKTACLSTEWSHVLCQIIEEFILVSPSLDLVPEPEVQTSSLLSGTMQSFLFAIKGNRKMHNLFTQFEPIWVQIPNTEGLNGTWNKRERKSTLCKTHKKKRPFTLQWVQQITNSGAVISHSFMVNCALTVTFQGVEHKLHDIYILGFSCSITPNGMMRAKRENSVTAQECLPAVNEVVNRYPGICWQRIEGFLWKLWSLIALHCLGCITANSALPPSWTSPGLEFLNFCSLWNVLLPFMWKGYVILSSLEW